MNSPSFPLMARCFEQRRFVSLRKLFSVHLTFVESPELCSGCVCVCSLLLAEGCVSYITAVFVREFWGILGFFFVSVAINPLLFTCVLPETTTLVICSDGWKQLCSALKPKVAWVRFVLGWSRNERCGPQMHDCRRRDFGSNARAERISERSSSSCSH